MSKYIEFYCPIVEDEETFTNKVFEVAHAVNGIMMPFSALHIAEKIVPPEIKKVVPIDQPLGMADGASRLRAAQSALNSGANIVDLAANIYLLRDRTQDFYKDIKAIKRLCEDRKAEIRITLDHREVAGTYEFVDYWKVVVDCGIDFISVSNGFFAEDIYDNIMMCTAIESKYGIRTLASGTLFEDRHFDVVRASGIYGFRISGVKTVLRLYNGV